MSRAPEMMSFRHLVLPLPAVIAKGGYQGWAHDAAPRLSRAQRKPMGWPFLSLDVHLPMDAPGSAMDLATMAVWIETFLRWQGVMGTDDCFCCVSLARGPRVAGCMSVELFGYRELPSYLAAVA